MARRAIEVIEHPLLRRHYRVATTAIESFVDLVERCLRVLIPGALVYARPRMGKTHAIDYVCLHLGRSRPDVLTLRMSCEHHRSDFEGPFFSALLIAAGASGGALKATNTDKRQELIRRLRERLAARRGHIVVLFCDEAQRQSKNAYEWLRDVHDQLAYHGIRLISFLVGQPQLLGQKGRFQMGGDEQIVARFMIEQLEFSGIQDAADAATCLAGYDQTRYPEHSEFHGILSAAGRCGRPALGGLRGGSLECLCPRPRRGATRRRAGNPDGLFYPCRGESAGAGQTL
jgi:hypothetical protein